MVEIINQNTRETEYIVRIKGNVFFPKEFSQDDHTIRIGYPETDQWKILENIKTQTAKDVNELNIEF